MIFCVNCGAANPQEARFCYRCGKQIVQTPAALSESSPPQAEPVAVLSRLIEPEVSPSPPYSATGPSIQPIYYPYSPVAAPAYSRAGPELVRYHPLAEGILGFPHDLQARPQEFYSYVDTQERLVFARRAGFWKRFGASIVDFLVLLVPLLVFSYIDGIVENKIKPGPNGTAVTTTDFDTSNSSISFLFLTFILGYFFLTGVLGKGQSFGKRAVKLKVMRLDGSKPDWITAVVRYLAGYLLSANILGLTLAVLIASGLGIETTLSGVIGLLFFGWGFWWSGWDRYKQTWHDKLARTLVVDTREYVEGFQFFRETKG